MYEDFPYTNLHQLNLDWMVDVIEKLHDNMVISVNGQTGEVILYQNATMQLPNVDDRTWTIIRNAHGVKRGIKFDQDGTAYIVSGNSLASVFTPENPPASSQVTYDQYVRLTTLTGEQLHNWNIFRTLNNQSTGIEFDDTGEAYIISGSNRYRLYSTKSPLPASGVTSVNGQTGSVVLYTDRDGEITLLPNVSDQTIDAWSIGRTINGITCRIYIYNDGQVTITAGSDEYRLINSEEFASAIRSSDIMVTSANMATTYDDFDDLPANEIIGVNASAITAGMAHAPAGVGVEVITISHITNDQTLQYAFPFNISMNKYVYMRALVNHVWTDWITVNLDPNYIGYDLLANGTQNSRSTEIVGILSLKNTCRLGPGDFYIDSIAINAGKTLIGCGNATRIIRRSASTQKYTIRLQANTTLQDITLLGTTGTITPANAWDIWNNSNPAIGGIRIEGTGSGDQTFRTTVNNVVIRGFAGPGFFIRRTGQSPAGGCLISNCFVSNCNAGMAIADYAEFHHVSGCIFQDNYYGAVNNGGNNTFNNCDFSNNICGVLMDNSSGSYPNNSHGGFVGCTFNHIGPIPASGIRQGGNAIELNTMSSGEIFSGCSIFYGNLLITASQGIIFNSCNFGSKSPISITNGNVVIFNSCVYRSENGVNESPLTLTNNTATKFNGCYYLSGREATAETLSE